MAKKLSVIVSLMFVIFSLFGCNSNQDETGGSSSTSNSLQSHDTEMVAKALEKYPDFPDLKSNESITKEVTRGEKTVTVIYSTSTEMNSHGSTTTTTENGEKWVEASRADYFVTLRKILETEDGNVESYWKYEYNPQTDKVEMVESEESDHPI